MVRLEEAEVVVVQEAAAARAVAEAQVAAVAEAAELGARARLVDTVQLPDTAELLDTAQPRDTAAWEVMEVPEPRAASESRAVLVRMALISARMASLQCKERRRIPILPIIQTRVRTMELCKTAG